MLDAGPSVSAASAGERIEFVEDNDRRGRLASAVEDLPQVLLALPDPTALEFGTADNRDRGADRGRDRFGEERLAGAGRAPEDHAARDQLFEPGDRFGVGCLILEREHFENFAPEAMLDFVIAADV